MENNDIRLIDADALMNDFCAACSTKKRYQRTNEECRSEENALYGYRCFKMRLIEAAPTIDAEPVRHGYWIPKKVDAIETEFQCSECGRTVECGNDYFGKPTKHVSSEFPYCHCGAKMDGDENETD